ncbi:MAG: menaquinone biosynthesis protein [Candidatus Sumerlaeaceae bacterium]|nr:menaquinone biosynthesis protein [Candidatus Sumerlaeaceae bacterium]
MTTVRPVPDHKSEPAEFALRVGSVPYLNVQPLVWAFSHDCDLGGCHWPYQLQIETAVPSALAALLRSGTVHLALAPVFEALQNPRYTMIPDIGIGCRGPVASVLLVSDSPLDAIRRIYLDPASLSSVSLVRVLAQDWKTRPEILSLPAGCGPEWNPGPGAARLLIGDAALHAAPRFAFSHDLGALWLESTGLPFVFAAWLVHPSARCIPLNDVMRRAQRAGLANLPRVAADTAPRFGFSPDFALRYFRKNVRYHLGAAELALALIHI